MSLILDALNRARQSENAVPGLTTAHPMEPLTARRRQYLLLGALIVAVAVIAALVVDRLRAPSITQAETGAPVMAPARNSESAADPSAAPGAHAEVSPQVQVPPATAAAAPAVAAPAVAAPAVAQAAPAALAQPAAGRPAASQSPSGTPAAAPQPKPSAAAVPDAAVAQLYQHRDLQDVPEKRAPATPAKAQRAAPAASGKRGQADVERILREARDEMENASLEKHPAPFLADLSQRTKDGIPTLYYQRHDYSSKGSQSSVTLNGNTVKAGGSILPGMKVEEILPDSVVLNYQGTQFRLRALNSWVNL